MAAMREYANAIETRFHGVTYKSREEARWAVFFESLGIDAKYEPEGFELILNRMRYLPDFYLPEQDYIIEIKTEVPNKDARLKANILRNYTEKDVFLFYKIPNPWASEGVLETDGALVWEAYGSPGHYDDGYYWTECPKGCEKFGFGITKLGRADLLPCNCFDEFYHALVNLTVRIFTAEELRLLWQWATYRFDSYWLCKAYDNARGASFDNDGNAYSGRNIPIRFWADGPSPAPDDNVKLLHLVHDIHEESSRDPMHQEELRGELANFGLGTIDWSKIRIINRILKSYNID